eukprot:scaffold281355_cov31-Prasinocladus_malaysianus.AAC.1
MHSLQRWHMLAPVANAASNARLPSLLWTQNVHCILVDDRHSPCSPACYALSNVASLHAAFAEIGGDAPYIPRTHSLRKALFVLLYMRQSASFRGGRRATMQVRTLNTEHENDDRVAFALLRMANDSTPTAGKAQSVRYILAFSFAALPQNSVTTG